MKKILFLAFITVITISVSCGGNRKVSGESMVVIHTDFGDMKIKLYDDTPKHRDNFVKLVNEGFYDDLLFHRVIKGFMIQGGDPNSKNAKPGDMLGNGSPGYTIPAEINPNHFHKKGAVAAARLGGSKNPEKNSSGSQFYIVEGKVFSNGELDTLETKMNIQRKELLFRELADAQKEKVAEFKKNNDRAGFDGFVAQLRIETDSIFEAKKDKFSFTPEEREIYTTIGGYPSLDGEYTVFGEVIEGLEVVDKIAEVKTNKSNRPEVDVRMKIEVLK